MIVKTEPTYWARIYISGPLAVAEQVLREECESGLCVTIEPTKFIYTGGEETGVVVGLVNYPRFPSSPEQIVERARQIAARLQSVMCQDSTLVVTPDKTEWVTRRAQ